MTIISYIEWKVIIDLQYLYLNTAKVSSVCLTLSPYNLSHKAS